MKLSEIADLLGVDPTTIGRAAARLSLLVEPVGGREKRISPEGVVALAVYYKTVPLSTAIEALREHAAAENDHDIRVQLQRQIAELHKRFAAGTKERMRAARGGMFESLRAYLPADEVDRLEAAYGKAVPKRASSSLRSRPD